MNLKFYTIWMKHGDGDAVLKDDIPLIKDRKKAFAEAKKLTKTLICGTKDVVLVRHITLGARDCKEWVFSPDD